MAFLKDLLTFLWGVISHWQSYVTGGVLPMMLFFIDRFVTNWRLTKRTLFVVFVVAFLLTSFFMVWREEVDAVRERDKKIDAQSKMINQLSPELSASIDALSVGEVVALDNAGAKNYAYFMLVATVRNTGAPSIVDRYTLKATFKDGSIEEAFITAIPSGWSVNYPNGQSEQIKDNEGLDERTLKPIERGGKTDGRLLFVVTDREKEWLKQNTKEIELRFFDAWGKEHFVSTELTGLATNIPAFPGLSQPNRKGEGTINAKTPIRQP